MHTPLNNSRKSIVKLPVSISWEDNTPVYVDLAKSLNGIKKLHHWIGWNMRA